LVTRRSEQSDDAPPPPVVRPVRRIVTIAAKEESPGTPDGAKDRIRTLLRGMGADARRDVLAELLHEEGGLVGRSRVEAAPSPGETGLAADAVRESVLAAVTDALGLSVADLARALYGSDTPSARSKARAALERWRRP
jgi:hypothetical protein